MKIRSITCFTDVKADAVASDVRRAADFLRLARTRFEEAGLVVQTVRMALPPFPTVAPSPHDVVPLALALEAAGREHGVEYLTLGPTRVGDDPAYTDAISEALDATECVFAAAEIANPTDGIDGAVRRVATVVTNNARLGQDGFVNLRFAALANVDAGVPFLPAAYHRGGPWAFAVATEAADLAVEALVDSTAAPTLAAARQRLVDRVDTHRRRITEIATAAGAERAARPAADPRAAPRFLGVDFSLAPFPTADASVARALESLGLAALGRSGSVAAAAFLASCLDEARREGVGFSGLFLPVLEDDQLARRSGEGMVTVEDLLLYASVCGTGLDTVPLPGDIEAEEIAAILLDVAALALRLDKPLTARLMPIPGRKAGDRLDFGFEYFAPGRVLAHKARPLTGRLASDERWILRPRPGRAPDA